jgi:hypothetical protein
MKITVTMQSKIFLLCAFLMFLSCGTALSQVVDYKTMSKEDLQNKIATFALGFDSYVVGKKITAAQLVIAEKGNDYKAYPGTVKFKDGDVFVIVEEKSNVVIALYKRNQKASKNDFKGTIAELMMLYGEPTAEAHGKTIYWSYGQDGLITEELYRTAKSQGNLETLTVLVTVKFSSSENVATITDLVEMMDKKNQQGEAVKTADVTSDNYVMIQSDLLTKKYMKN